MLPAYVPANKYQIDFGNDFIWHKVALGAALMLVKVRLRYRFAAIAPVGLEIIKQNFIW